MNLARSSKRLLGSALFTALLFPSIARGQNECQPVTWGLLQYAVEEIVCRYKANTASPVNYYTCSELAARYNIDIETFFQLNPNMDRECKKIKPDTEYCVQGYIQYPISSDGLCGTPHGEVSCLGTPMQCCNGETWKCGNSTVDCAPGTCHSGACEGFPSEYSMDGKCGPKNGNKKCGGKWGDCCSLEGNCGTGEGYCGVGKCDFGNCTQPTPSRTTTRDLPWQTGTTPDGSCGGSKGYTCSVVYGGCCSKDGVCGASVEHCGTGCQSKFGRCAGTGALVPPPPVNTPVSGPKSGSISLDGTCGGSKGLICKGSEFGDCCSSSGFCGNTSAYCIAGCQPSFGICTSGSSKISTDGTCGGAKGLICKDSGFGDCCSSSGFCGASAAHCSAGCQTSFGACTSMDSKSVSQDGTCGGSKGLLCKGSPFGECCSTAGYCGNSAAHCGGGCQSAFGTCSPGKSKTSVDGSCGGPQQLSCVKTEFGGCCSSSGYCGKTVDHCGLGCQKPFSNGCLTSNIPSVDGSCGGKDGFTCKGGQFDGQCCSAAGYCGSTPDYCTSGCQRNFGVCK